ncbi:GNAT family N-acetyltransferase [Clostridium neuense]|uniref:GNAT family N-acetyltransferase n=1 Tax=Clostridium neuense TaxID=1728934 RepID=A0ABW8TJX7_9CLOT
MNGIGTQKIETDRLILRRFGIEDSAKVYKNWTSDSLTTRYLSWDTHENEAVTREYIKSKLSLYDNEFFFDWIVIRKEDYEPIGEISCVKFSKFHRLCEMGDCYGSKYWNLGYGTEALKAFIKYMLKKVEVDIVIACHTESNAASGRIMEKAGMRKDAVLPNYFVNKETGKREAQVYYSIER